MGKTVLLTGATGGLGNELAHVFAKNGFDIILVARKLTQLENLKSALENEYGCSAYCISQDLCEKDAAAAIFAEVERQGLDVEILINNAGFGDFATFTESDWKKQYEMIQVNIVALVQLTRLITPAMVARGSGRIMNVGSMASFMPGPYLATYYASKAYVLSFTEALSAELRGSGVSITALCPGPTRTGFESRADLEASRLFKVLKQADAVDVAEYGYRSLMRGKVIAIHGFINRLIVYGAKFSPRWLVRKMVRWFDGLEK